MVSDAQKKASAKWDKENMIVVGPKLKRSYAADFRAMCEAVGTTPSAVIRKAIDDFMEANTEQGQHSAGDEVSQTYPTASREGVSQTDTPSPADGVSNEMRGAMDVLKAAAAAQIADASHEMRNTNTKEDDETEARRAALLESIKGL